MKAAAKRRPNRYGLTVERDTGAAFCEVCRVFLSGYVSGDRLGEGP